MRIDYAKVSPEAITALTQASAYLSRSGIDHGLRFMVEVRVSQINGCAYCVDMHTQQARKAGVGQQKLDCIAAWREAGAIFTDRERAALAWADSVTRIADGGVPDEVFGRAREHFSERELVDLNMVVAVMNAWNRIAVSFERAPDLRV